MSGTQRFALQTIVTSRPRQRTPQTMEPHGMPSIARFAPACIDAIATAFLVSGVLPDHDRFCDGPSPDLSLAAVVPIQVPSWPVGSCRWRSNACPFSLRGQAAAPPAAWLPKVSRGALP